MRAFRSLAQYILKHPAQGNLVLGLLGSWPLVQWLAYVLQSVVMMQRGFWAGSVAFLWANVGFVIYALVIEKYAILLEPLLMSGLVLLGGVGFLWKQKWSWILTVFTLFGCLGVLGMHYVVPDVPAWWQVHFQQAWQDMGNLKSTAPDIAPVLPYMTGLQGAGFLFLSLMVLAMGRSIHADLAESEQARWEIQNHRFSPWALLMWLPYLGLSLMKHHPVATSLAKDLLPIFLLPWAVTGLAWCHQRIQQTAGFWFLLVFYSLVFLFFQYSAIALALLGMVLTLGLEQWNHKQFNS